MVRLKICMSMMTFTCLVSSTAGLCMKYSQDFRGSCEPAAIDLGEIAGGSKAMRLETFPESGQLSLDSHDVGSHERMRSILTSDSALEANVYGVTHSWDSPERISTSVRVAGGAQSSHFRQKRSAMISAFCHAFDQNSLPDFHGNRIPYTRWEWASAICQDPTTILFACIKTFDYFSNRQVSNTFFALFPCPVHYYCREFQEPNVYWSGQAYRLIWTAECTSSDQTRNYINGIDEVQVCSSGATYAPIQAAPGHGVDLTLSLSNAAYHPNQSGRQRTHVVHELWFEDVTPGKVSRRLGDTFDKSIATYNMPLTALIVIRFCAALAAVNSKRPRLGHFPVYNFRGGGYISRTPYKMLESSSSSDTGNVVR